MIFFDLDETLFDFKSAEYTAVNVLYSQLLDPSTCNREDFYKSWCAIGMKHFGRFLRGELTFEQQKIARITELLQSVGLPMDEDEARRKFQIYLDHFEKNWRTFDDVLPCLESLRGRRLGLITNGDPDQQRQKMKKVGIFDYFEVVVTAGDIGSAKPDPAIFTHACRLAETDPADCTYIGDNFETDIIPCEKLNMKAIWLDRKREGIGTPYPLTIHSLMELPAILGAT
jgi:putative hydrolase of the HAD superfamily